MNKTLSFDRNEYEKMMQLLELQNNKIKEKEDDSNYFNAWNFGQTESDCNFIIKSSIEK